MKIELLKFVDYNTKTKELKDEVEFRKELAELVSHIVKGDDCYYTNNEDIIKKLGLNAKKSGMTTSFGWGCYSSFEKYYIKLTKANIKRIQDYIDDEENN